MFGEKPMLKWIKTDRLGICNSKMMNIADGLLGLAVLSIAGAIAIRCQGQEWEPSETVENDDGSETIYGIHSKEYEEYLKSEQDA